MTIDQHDHHDAQVDEALRELGTRLDDTLASSELSRRVSGIVSGREAAGDRARLVPSLERRIMRLRWAVTGLTTVAATLALASAMLFVHVNNLEQAIETEAIGRTHVVGHPVLSDDTKAEFLILTQHYDMCARAQTMTPWFEGLKSEFQEAPVLFAVFDLSPRCRMRAAEMAQRLGVDLEKFKNGQYPATGKAWVIDMETRKVILELKSPADRDEFVASLKSKLAQR